MNEMMEMYPTIKKHFKNIVPITACMNETNPYPEGITFPNFADYTAGKIAPANIPDMTNFKVASATYSPLSAATQTGSTVGGNGQLSTGTKKSGASPMVALNNWTAVSCVIFAVLGFFMIA